MDKLVQQALAKWPNVPHCYGWLGLDARGVWRMRDAQAQALQLPGEKIVHAALLGFINRNYGHDERGCWFFQNGPQRVYLTLAATPYIVRTDPACGFMLHTGVALGQPDALYLCSTGELIAQQGERVAQLDDRDLAQTLSAMLLDGQAPDDAALMGWLDGAAGSLTLHGQALQRIAYADLAERFGFVRTPEPA